MWFDIWVWLAITTVTLYCSLWALIIKLSHTMLHLFYYKYSKKKVILWNIFRMWSRCFLCEYLLKYNLFMWSKLYFHHHYSSLQCHMIFRNHNMLIYCSRNVSDYYQCWKQLCCTIFLCKLGLPPNSRLIVSWPEEAWSAKTLLVA